MKRTIKELLGRSLFASGLGTMLLRDAAVVVAFHRVQETDGSDGLTVSVPQFERFCRFFARHFEVTSLGDLVDRLHCGSSLRRRLAITFDDGYRDNFENAAPVLERLGLPATFFIVSEWMDTDVVAWWDRERGVRHPWMTWAQVQSLRARGFTIGAHTRTHADLGTVTDAQAGDEVIGARRELERRLGGTVDLFAYPYGRRGNLAASNRDLVRRAGFRCCCSCFGGVVPSGSDPFHLSRVPITPWFASPQQFGFEVAAGLSLVSA
jgi:peptidoglycan/xylan/chitin deacetylase (PgdA/CDA1 family)